MIRIDNEFLQNVGLARLPDWEKNLLLEHLYDTLEMRVGVRLSDDMSNEQLDEFEHYFQDKDDAGAFKWLETNFPNYKDIVQAEFDVLKDELLTYAPEILEYSRTADRRPAPQLPRALEQVEFRDSARRPPSEISKGHNGRR